MEADGVLAMTRWLGVPFSKFIVGATFFLPAGPIGTMRRFDAIAFFAAVNAKREADGLSWKETASKIPGFTPGMLTRLAKGGRMEVGKVVSLACWLRKAPEEFTYAAKA
jgi:hypothetical protein